MVAADLLSQAEHDEAAYPLLACTSQAIAEAVRAEVEAQLASLPRRAIAEASVRGQGCALVVGDADGLVAVANRLAAEHLSIQTAAAHELARRVLRAGAIFVGHATPEAAGDYFAGPSHVLPTGGAVRFGSPLGVYDFVTRSSIVAYDAPSLRAQADDITTFARLEGLEARRKVGLFPRCCARPWSLELCAAERRKHRDRTSSLDIRRVRIKPPSIFRRAVG